jgi:hypothetical protein
MADADESTSLAAEGMLQREASAAAVVLVGGTPSVSDGNVIQPLILG